MYNALSVDVEDYFMVENFASSIRFEDWDNYPLRLEKSVHQLLNLFEAHRTNATFFILGWVAEKLPNMVKTIAAAGHEIACHGYSHRPVYELGKKKFKEEIKLAKQTLENISGQPILGYRAATYSINSKTSWIWDVLSENGFQYDSSYRPFLFYQWDGMPFNEPRVIQAKSGIKMMEFPITVKKIAGLSVPFYGGGYFRLFPIKFVEKGIQKLNNREIPANVYIHPWEVDPDQPRLKASPINRFRHYVNLSKTQDKLRYLLERFHFAPLREVLNI